MLVQQKAISTHMREYASAAENSKQHTSICFVWTAYSLILHNIWVGVRVGLFQRCWKVWEELLTLSQL